MEYKGKWVRALEDGRMNVHDEERSVRPSVVTEDLVQKVDKKSIAFHNHVASPGSAIELATLFAAPVGGFRPLEQAESESISHSSEDEDNNKDIYSVSSGERFSESLSKTGMELEEPVSKKSTWNEWNWTLNSNTVKEFNFTATPEDDFWNLLSEETNKFDDAYLKSPTASKTDITNEWFDATADEMRAYFSLCVDGSRYCMQFSIYTGKKQEIPKDVPSSEAVVVELMKPYLCMGYTVAMDNWYSSPDLFKKTGKREN
ncbi:hypothetical protein J437_LFUL018674 [Ladona fulva]|nr:hypothetical protein J437_LFUL018674 [Ladona fulva]